ncbi:ubiquitin-conjugating enzyme/RWD-like protein [Dipodascopsis uninucleata]
MATKAAHKRLAREYKHMQESPPPFIIAHPSEKNILIWHYLITGPPATPYEGGQYHGTLTFPSEYPYKPPAIRMITPSGRFQTNTRLCLSISDYHPKTWNPAWSVSTILTGLLSFMTSTELTTGALRSTDEEKRQLAEMSKEWNLRQNRRFVEEFPAETEENEKWVRERRKIRGSSTTTNTIGSSTNANGADRVDIEGAAINPHLFERGSGSNGQLGMFDKSVLASTRSTNRSTTGKSQESTNKAEDKDNTSNSWIGSHKFLCICVAILAWAFVSRVSGFASV